MTAITTTELSLPGRRQGKVRDTYELTIDGQEAILIVATDRISAYDIVLPTPLPGKGRILTAISERWLRWIEERSLAKTYLITTDADQAPGLSDAEREAIRDRVTIGRRCRVVPIECVARGYLAGSGWVEYRASRSVCGVSLPEGLRTGEKLPQAIFTPATKAEQGEHDENISYERACELVSEPLMSRMREATLSIYEAAAAYALERGVIIADTKFEFGLPLDAGDEPDELLVIDEALTPDSSRFWPAESWTPGQEQTSFDKQYVREYLLSLIDDGRWNKTAPGPELPEKVVFNTLRRYEEAFSRLFDESPKPR